MRFFQTLILFLIVFAPLVYAGPHAAQIPALDASGDDKEMTLLSKSDDLKLAAITLRRGTALPTHSTPSPATVLVLEGQGIIHVDGEPAKVKKGSVVMLEAGAPHDVVPAEGTDMQLLVHYLLSAPKSKENRSHGHDGHNH